MKIKLEIYDFGNRKVKTLVDDIKEAGTYEIELSAKELVSGEYLYKLETDKYCDTKKMIVLK